MRSHKDCFEGVAVKVIISFGGTSIMATVLTFLFIVILIIVLLQPAIALL